MTARRLTAAVLGCVLLAGCGQVAGKGAAGPAGGADSIVITTASGRPSTSPTVPARYGMSISCPGEAVGLGGHPPGTLPADDVVTGARVCRQVVVDRPGRGAWQQEVTYEVVGGLEALVHRYRHPDGPPGSGPCDAVGHLPLLVTFTTARGPVQAREPRGVCGQPDPEAVQAYNDLGLRVIGSAWQGQVSSQRALDTGCAQQWKNMLWVERDRSAAAGSARLATGPQRLCVYRDDAPSSGGGNPSLVTAGALTAQESKALLAHLHPAAGCRSASGRYVVLGEGLPGESNGEVVYLSLDACRGKALWDSGTGELDPVGVQLLGRLLARTH